MNERFYCVFSIFIVAIFMAGCPFMGLAYEEELDNGYAVWASDVIEQAAVVHKDKRGSGATSVVPSMVFAYGWNDDFILAKRHPVKDFRKVDTNLTYWYIVEVASGNVHGPLSEGEFNKIKTEFKVPTEISFKTIQ
jgi:hypothetical protein